MNKIVSRLVISLLLISLFLSGCKSNRKVFKEPELLSPVNVSDRSEVATYRTISNILPLEAHVVPYPEDLSFDRDGIFEKYHVSLGDKVKKGQVLVSQSDTEYETELNQLVNNYKDMQLAYEEEKQLNSVEKEIIHANLEKEKAMMKAEDTDRKNEILARIDKLKLSLENIEETSLSKYRMYQIQQSDLNAKIVALKKKIENNTIVAPFDGVVSYIVDIEKGSQVNRDTPLIQVVDTSKKYITCELEEMHKINQANKIYVTINGKNYDLEPCDSLNNKSKNSSLQSIMSNCNFTLKNGKDKVEFGDVGVVCISSNYKENVLTVSYKAVRPDGLERHFVYRLNNGQKEKVYVEIGTQTDFYYEIISGLKEGDVVSNEY